nr:hypothetical protein CFP56_69045 [Quercus suber]
MGGDSRRHPRLWWCRLPMRNKTDATIWGLKRAEPIRPSTRRQSSDDCLGCRPSTYRGGRKQATHRRLPWSTRRHRIVREHFPRLRDSPRSHGSSSYQLSVSERRFGGRLIAGSFRLTHRSESLDAVCQQHDDQQTPLRAWTLLLQVDHTPAVRVQERDMSICISYVHPREVGHVMRHRTTIEPTK